MPRKVHDSCTIVFPTRVEVSTLARLDKFVLQKRRDLPKGKKHLINRNMIVLEAINDWLRINDRK